MYVSVQIMPRKLINAASKTIMIGIKTGILGRDDLTFLLFPCSESRTHLLYERSIFVVKC